MQFYLVFLTVPCAIIGLMNIFPKIEGTLIFGVQIKIMNVIESKEL